MRSQDRYQWLAALQMTADYSERHQKDDSVSLAYIHCLFSELIALDAVEDYEQALKERRVA